MEGVDSQREETGVLTWKDVIGSEKEQAYFMDTLATVRAEREAGKVIYPPATEVFNAFKLTELDDVKVVILGQDPYHGPDQAHGLCFSVLPGVRTPPPSSTSTRRCSGICRVLSHPITASWNPGPDRECCCSIRC
jgi:uracil-DNA glycosylase